MKHSIWFWLYFIVAIIMATYFTTRTIMTGLGYGGAAHIHNIYINTNADHSDLNTVAAAAAIAPGTRTYTANLKQINDRVNAVPGVRASSIRRTPNGNLSIKVDLYKAVASWTDGENYFPLSGDGTIVNKPSSQRVAGSIVFKDEIPNEVSQITHDVKTLIGYIDYMQWIENRRWNIQTTTGITILLPEINPSAAIGTLFLLNKNHQLLSKDVKIIDMRDTARILIR